MKPRCSQLIVMCLMVMFISAAPTLAVSQSASTPGAAAPTADVLIAIHPKGLDDGSRFEVELKPGDSETLTASLTNFGTEPIKLRTYSAGIVPAPNGGLVIAPHDAERQGSLLWLDYPEEELTLEPSQVVDREIQVSVPKDTPAGQYVNAVVLETVDPIKDTSGAFEQYYRKVVSVYVTVPGDVNVDFSFGEPEVLVAGGLAGVQIPVSNDGNVRIDLRGELTLTASDGTVVHSGEVSMGPVYMQQQTVLQIPFATVPPPGDYTLTYTLADQSSGVSKTTESQAIVVPEAASTVVAPISFDNIVVEANADPVVFANVSVDVTASDANYPSTRLTLSVYLNGEFVEDFVLADSLSVAQGTTHVTQRYLPATGFESGTYTFSMKLESTDGDQVSLLLEEKDVATLEVP